MTMYQKLRNSSRNAFGLRSATAAATTRNAPTNVAGDGNVITNSSATIDSDIASHAVKGARRRGAGWSSVGVFARGSRAAPSAIDTAIARNANGRFRAAAAATIARDRKSTRL